MVELSDLTKVGFGAYRISIDSVENELALTNAIQFGCNLVDTASNYADGNSEMLIGKVLKNNPTADIFIVSKAGYISGSNLKAFKKINKMGGGLTDLVDISNSFKHSIHPDYLETQINISLKRLGRKCLDGFLLHSPEYFFHNENVNHGEYYNRIKTAFEFLEEKVKKGVIRYYGISSNNFTTDASKANGTDLYSILELSRQVSSNSHFKLIQFPFNIAEQQALISTHPSRKSLIELARENDIITFSNRPLNANTPNGLLRLTYQNLNSFDLNDIENFTIYTEFMNSIQNQLKKDHNNINIDDIGILFFLKENWMNIDNTEKYNKIFYEMLHPFVQLIFNNNVPRKFLIIMKKFESVALQYHQKILSLKTINYLKINNLKDLLDDSETLPNALVRRYLKSGINHVLVGMTNVSYVDELQNKFNNKVY